MIGHQNLLKMRRLGHVPVGVWITDGDTPCATDWHQERNPFNGRYCPAVRIDATDNPDALDLRFVIGLPVHCVAARGVDRAIRLHNALVNANASIVITGASGEFLIHPKA